MSKKCKFPELKQEIKTREAASREIRKRIRATTHMERWDAWHEKRQEGNTTRCLLLMYAMLRGIPRSRSEAKYSFDDMYWILNGIKFMAGQGGYDLTNEAIEQWLRATPPAVQVEIAGAA